MFLESDGSVPDFCTFQAPTVFKHLLLVTVMVFIWIIRLLPVI